MVFLKICCIYFLLILPMLAQGKEVFTYPNNQWMDTYLNPEESSHNQSYIYVLSIKEVPVLDLKKALSIIFPDVRISINEGMRQLIVRCNKDVYQKIQSTINKMDIALQQLTIEVQIIELSSYNFEEYKMAFSKLTEGFRINYDFKNNQINSESPLEATLLQLTSSGKASVLAKPMLVTQDNHAASIRIGDKVPYVTGDFIDKTRITTVQYLDTGIDLVIHPKITQDNRVSILIDANISAVKLWKSFLNSQYPVISTRSTKTEVVMSFNETLIIAGLFDRTGKSNQSKLPFFSWIPIIGNLFKGHNHEQAYSDIVFLITPQISSMKKDIKKENKKALE